MSKSKIFRDGITISENGMLYRFEPINVCDGETSADETHLMLIGSRPLNENPLLDNKGKKIKVYKAI